MKLKVVPFRIEKKGPTPVIPKECFIHFIEIFPNDRRAIYAKSGGFNF
jgi:hypothetical protein